MSTWIIALNGQAVRTIRAESRERAEALAAEDFGPAWKANGIEVLTYGRLHFRAGDAGPECGSGWTGDRCTKAEGHSGRHSNDGAEDQAHRARRIK